jgi:hypothetical protein
MKDKLIAKVRRDLILNSSVRYGLARNVPATDEHGKPVLLCLAILERDNGEFEVHAIREDLIRFAGEGIIKDEILRRFYG